MATRVVIMGAGAIGSIIGGMLARSGVDVTLLDQWPAQVDSIKQHGLRLSGTSGDYVVPVHALHLYEAQAIEEPLDVVFLSVKGYDTDLGHAVRCPIPRTDPWRDGGRAERHQ